MIIYKWIEYNLIRIEGNIIFIGKANIKRVGKKVDIFFSVKKKN